MLTNGEVENKLSFSTDLQSLWVLSLALRSQLSAATVESLKIRNTYVLTATLNDSVGKLAFTIG
jgi:hypothetical protein